MYLIQDNVTEVDIMNISNGSTNLSQTNIDYDKINGDFWIYIEAFLFIVISLGNVLTIVVIVWSRKLRKILSNYFIFNLAVADLLVGVSLPYHLAFYINHELNRDKTICISRFVIVNLGCAQSIYSLIAIALDRYIGILHPLTYNAYVTQKHVLLVILVTWICAMGVATVPIYWNNFKPSTQSCEVELVLPRYYVLCGQLLLQFILCWIMLFLLYWKIWKKARIQKRRMNVNIVSTAEKNDRKSMQMVILIIGCFSICWTPVYIMICVRVFGWRTPPIIIFYKCCLMLALANSGMNPMIYAWKNNNFRKAFYRVLCFKSPNNLNANFKNYFAKQHELKRQQMDKQTNVRRDCHINENKNLHSSDHDQQSNYTEETSIDSTNL